jgi:DNA-binding LacI/PurR family transcriptional regulator
MATGMKSTIQDVAKYADVSVATVSHVINNTHYVSPELKQRVLEAVEALNYRPNKLARALNRRDIPLLALIVPDIRNPYWSSFARSFQDVTDQHNYSVIVCSSDGHYDREIRFLRSLSGWISGLILHPYNVTQEDVNQIIGDSIPMVILGDFTNSENQPSNWDWVASNNLESAQLAVEHLIDLGHRDIAFIQGPVGTPTSVRRLRGYQSALELAGIPIKEEWLAPGDYTQSGGFTAMKAMLSKADPPTAVFCANDLSALGALEAAKQSGYRVPQDISIVGFDDIDEAALASPPLTTIRLLPRHVGNVAAEALLERLQGRVEPKRTLIEGSLIIRQSTAEPVKLPTVPSSQ